ncbi:MAG: S8 family serine peptidase [Vicinamibacteria bacterium]
MRTLSRRFIGTALALALAPVARGGQVGSAVYEALAAPDGGGRVRVIVSLRELEARAGSLALRLPQVEIAQRRALEALDPDEFALTHRWDTVAGFAGSATPSAVEKLRRSPEVDRVDLDPAVRAHLGVSVPLIRAREVQDAGFTGQGVAVAVIDTGVESGHPDLSGDVIGQACFCAGNCCPNGTTQQTGAGAGEDDNGHGTAVASIISGGGRAAPRGVAPDSQIVSIKVLDRTGAGAAADLVSALDYVVKSRPEVKVVNMSLGLSNLFDGVCDNLASFTQVFAQSIGSLKARGTAVFVSSGNDGNKSQIAVPACIGAAVSVGAVYERNAGTISFGCTDSSTDRDQVACFSNSSSKLDVVAPGAPILASGRGGGTQTTVGTSEACPHAAGVAALLFQATPGLTVDRLVAAIKTSSVTVTDRANGRATPRLDAKAALDASR